ncbi:hypothetical protein [Pararhodobacter oceanensis]|uniref:hypothetical protein n=1 Tax=Pararhodobacter oceanensis TaxID=2172121 RepID=UPI003A8ECD15
MILPDRLNAQGSLARGDEKQKAMRHAWPCPTPAVDALTIRHGTHGALSGPARLHMRLNTALGLHPEAKAPDNPGACR